MKNQKTILLIIGTILVIVGLVKPDISNILKSKPDNTIVVVVEEPTDTNLKQACGSVISILRQANSPSDAKRLSQLYMDMATLIELDGENSVILTTEDIKQANSLSGLMLRLDIKDKYKGLADAAKAVIITGIGDDAITLDETTRIKAAESFKALAWACNEGSK